MPVKIRYNPFAVQFHGLCIMMNSIKRLRQITTDINTKCVSLIDIEYAEKAVNINLFNLHLKSCVHTNNVVQFIFPNKFNYPLFR